MTFDDVRALARVWPGVEDATSYGTPALKVRGKLLARLREDGDSLVIKGIAIDEREMLIAANPAVFHITDHYRDWAIVLVRLSMARPLQVEPLLLRYWRTIAGKTRVAAFERNKAR